MPLSKVRIDPLAGVYNFRGYGELGDPMTPLASEPRKYKVVGTVTISGAVATVSATLGDMSDVGMRKDFDNELMNRGVTSIRWERHAHGHVSHYTRKLRR